MLKLRAAGKAWKLSYNYYADKLLAAVLLKDDVIVENDCVCKNTREKEEERVSLIIRGTAGRRAFLFVSSEFSLPHHVLSSCCKLLQRAKVESTARDINTPPPPPRPPLPHSFI